VIRLFAILLLALVGAGALQAQDRWLGLPVTPEARCAPFDAADYPVPDATESQLLNDRARSFCSLYNNQCFIAERDVVIDPVVALAEAHDSGLCAADSATRSAFAADIRNLAIAAPGPDFNRKGERDAAGWLPAQNRCWFAETVVKVRRAYNLSIDLDEVDALIGVLTRCIAANRLLPVGDYVVTGTDNVNARACPSTSCAVVTRFVGGQLLEVSGHVTGTALNADSQWLKLRHEEGDVYLHASLAEPWLPDVTPAAPLTTDTQTAGRPAVVDPAPSPTTWYVNASRFANARSCPDTSCNVVTSFRRGEALQVLQRVTGESINGVADWQAVRHNEELLYVHEPLLSRSKPAPLAPTPLPQRAPQQGQTTGRVSAPAIGGGFALGGQALGFTAPQHMHAARMTWVKRQVRYHRGDNPADVNWVIGQARGAGFHVLLSIVGEPGEMAPDPAGYTRDFVNFLGGVASLGPNAIEVWNEQNIDREWPSGQISPQAYTSMLSQAWNAIKAANPGVMVISGAPAPTGFFGGGCAAGGCDDLPFIRGMAAAGAANYMDCVGVHYNEGILGPDARSGDPRGNSGHYTRYYSRMFEVYAAAFPGKPLCFTEIGYLSSEGYGPLPGGFAWAANVTVADQAAWLGRAVTLARSSGRVRLFIVWNVDATRYDSDPQAGFAIVRPGGGCPACASLAAAMG